jgi:CRP/FNR family cyclic AMP-dependent transcriptional regulator
VNRLPIDAEAYRTLARIARELEFFRSFTGAQAERILSRLDLYAYEKGETIFKKGEPSIAFYLIHKGHVRIHLGYRFWGLFKKMAHLSVGDLFGEMGLLEGRVRSATAVAMQPTEVFVLLKEEFDKLMRADTEFADLMKFISSRRKFEAAR